LILPVPVFTQLLLLGYQRRVKSSILKGNLFFFNLPNIVSHILFTKCASTVYADFVSADLVSHFRGLRD